MIAQRAAIAVAGTAALLLTGMPAAAQVSETIIVNIMRECAKIDDPTARLACYDNNIRAAGAAPRATVPGQVQVPQGGGAPAAANTPQGFGARSVRTQQQSAPAPAESQPDEISARVVSISQRSPGIYVFTLEGGAQWQFSDSVGPSYRVPRAGSTVEIERGALGAFLMRYDGQQSVGVRRIR